MPFTQAWTDHRIEQVRAYKHWVYVAISRIALKIASHRPNISYVYNRDSSHSSPAHLHLRSMAHKAIGVGMRRKALTPLLSHEELIPAEHDHPLCRLLADPNEPDTAGDLWYETILFWLLTGNAFWWVPKNEFIGLPCAAWVIPSHWMWPIYGRNRLIESWEIRPIEGNYMRRRLPADEVIHFQFKNPTSKISGFSPMTAGAPWIDMEDTINKSALRAYQNGTFPSVAVQFDGKLQDPSDEDLRRIEAKFIARYVGDMPANKPLFLPPGVSVKPLVLKPNEMLFGETEEKTRDKILALFGVPKLIAGMMDGMTYGSIAAAVAGFCSFTISPLCRMLGESLSEKLAPQFDSNLRIWWEDCTPDDPELVLKRIQTSLMAAAITPNEIRAEQGKEPFPWAWADEPIMPVNMTSMSGSFGGANQTPPATDPGIPQPHVSEETSAENFINRLLYPSNNLHLSNGHAH